MKFETIGSAVVNLEHLEQIYCETEPDAVTKTYDEATQTINTAVAGNPYKIVFCLASGQQLRLEYKIQSDRDLKFQGLQSALTR